MEQLYLIEIFLDKVTIFASDDENSANKHLIVKIKFGPQVEFIVKEGQMAPNKTANEDIIECDEVTKQRKWSRTIRVGKSYLFPSFPDTIMTTLSKFPLLIEVWNDDETEIEIFVGVGRMIWDSEFYNVIRDTAIPCKIIDPITIKQKLPLFAECCCSQNGEVTFILRLTALGDSIITEFQQLLDDPEVFVFRTNKAPSMFQCKRVEGDDPNFTMVGSLYETTTLEDPDLTKAADEVIEICTDLQACGNAPYEYEPLACKPPKPDEHKRRFPIEKIKMGEISGPCGNTNCALAHKVRTYIRNLDSYKKAAAAAPKSDRKPEKPTKKTCGSCICKDDTWHRDSCPEKTGEENKVLCSGCGGMTQTGNTCIEKLEAMYGTGATPVTSTHSTKQYHVFIENKFHHNNKKHVTRCCSSTSNIKKFHSPTFSSDFDASSENSVTSSCSSPSIPSDSIYNIDNYKCDVPLLGYQKEFLKSIINLEPQVPKCSSKIYQVYNCMEISPDKTCRCKPRKEAPPCSTFDCQCYEKAEALASRKVHKPFCPSYIHKATCPVLETEDTETNEEEVKEEPEALPYGLPPVKLGPCPVMGRPCSVPDGFARMYKVGAVPPGVPSYSDAGKVCCSKEYERIKKAIADYLKVEKGPDYRCVNKFNVDTERRCCDKDQRLRSLMGEGCCGTHKMAIRDQFKNNNNDAPS